MKNNLEPFLHLLTLISDIGLALISIIALIVALLVNKACFMVPIIFSISLIIINNITIASFLEKMKIDNFRFNK